MRASLTGKLTLALLAILAITGAAWVALILVSSRLYQEEVEQSLNRPLAGYISEAFPLIEGGEVNRPALARLFDQLMVINPRIEVYLLDREGRILAYSAEPGQVKRARVDLGPVREWLGGGHSAPLRGDDPRDPAGRKAFSAATVRDAGAVAGYLYVVLGGEAYRTAADMVAGSHILRLALGGGAIALLFAIAAGILCFNWITRRLSRLTGAVERFHAEGFGAPMQLAGWRRDGDEVDRLGVLVEEMSQRIADQIEQLRQSDAARREMVTNISHDLRTPLASLQGYLETLLIKDGAFTPEQKRHHLELALRQGDRLSRLVTELFELTTLDSTATRLNFEPFSLAELVQDVAQKFRLEAERRKLTLDTDIPGTAPFVRADIGLIERVLENLIENAIKYTPEGGAVRLSLAAAPDGLTTTIADTGCGIPAEDLGRIFDRFYRVEKSRANAPEGAGLGLAITRRILQLHDRGIDVDSEPGRGSVFTFSLPFAKT